MKRISELKVSGLVADYESLSLMTIHETGMLSLSLSLAVSFSLALTLTLALIHFSILGPLIILAVQTCARRGDVRGEVRGGFGI